jgi:acetate CoA/acetoacetate CoA-transferase beta subunit
VKSVSLPLTSVRPIDLLVTEMAVIAFPNGQATLMETAPGVSVSQVVAATEAELVVSPDVKTMTL